MRIRWRGLELPSEVVVDRQASTARYGRFIIEPFERGFGTTVGNSLRRVLLSSLEGAAVTAIKIAGADHEFCSMPGVMEDVADIILNIKGLIVKMDSETPRRMKLSRQGPGQVTAGDLEFGPDIQVINPDLVIATLTDSVTFTIEMEVKAGRGYRTADENMGPEQELGVIPIDSVFSPVTRVRFKTEDARVGQRIDYDRLILEIWTKGTVEPHDALVEAAKILRKHLNPFVQYHDFGDELASGLAAGRPASEPMPECESKSLLDAPIGELDLSVRARNCLESARITTVRQLVTMAESDLLGVRSFGKTSLHEVKRKLTDLGLSLGMDTEALATVTLTKPRAFPGKGGDPEMQEPDLDQPEELDELDESDDNEDL